MARKRTPDERREMTEALIGDFRDLMLRLSQDLTAEEVGQTDCAWYDLMASARAELNEPGVHRPIALAHMLSDEVNEIGAQAYQVIAARRKGRILNDQQLWNHDNMGPPSRMLQADPVLWPMASREKDCDNP